LYCRKGLPLKGQFLEIDQHDSESTGGAFLMPSERCCLYIRMYFYFQEKRATH